MHIRGKFFWRVFLGTALLLVLVVATCVWLILGAFDRFYAQEMESHLRKHAEILRYQVEPIFDGAYAARLDEIARAAGSAEGEEARVTFIAPDGTVYGDSSADATGMENHAGREEVRLALRDGWGATTRYSNTVHREMMYFALRLGTPDDLRGFVRVAMPMRRVISRAQAARQIFLRIAVTVLAAAVVLALWLARLWSDPIARITAAARSLSRGDLSARIDEHGPADEIGRLARSLNRMRDRMTQAIKVRTDFVANASHELRTPLSAIRAAVETLRSIAPDENPATADRLIRVIDKHSMRLDAMVSDLLSLSRLESADGSFRASTLSVGELLRDLHDRFAESLREKSLHWSVESTMHNETIVASRHLLSLVLDNLVHNAIKFTEPGGNVTVRCARTGAGLLLAVADDGCGIPEEEQERVFERFYQVERARSGEKRGTGLGLSIVRHAVIVMNGSIRLDSKPGAGTTITVEIPQPAPGETPAQETGPRRNNG